VNIRQGIFWALCAPIYDYAWGGAVGAALATSLVDLIPTGSRVVDLGGGTGLVAAILAMRGHCVEVIEPSSSMASKASRILGPNRVNGHHRDGGRPTWFY